MKAKKFVYSTPYEGEPKLTDFELVEEVLPKLNDGDVLCEATYLSVDPYMRPYMSFYPTGITMIGVQVAKIIESKNEEFPVGEFICGEFGWRTHTIFNPKDAKKMFKHPHLLPSFGNLPKSLAIGALGMPGNTAYFGFLEICQPKSGETVVVSGAAGAVGTLVGQIAKLKGCRVIGIAGSKEKCDWIVSDLGFDVAINYKNENIAEALSKAAPNGVDCYFDNVGGGISTAVIQKMKLFGRISVCGAISGYNSTPDEMEKQPQMQSTFIFRQLKMEGFIVGRWEERWFEGIEQMRNWILDGKIKYQETITEGFENTPKVLIDIFNGKNLGKAVVKV